MFVCVRSTAESATPNRFRTFWYNMHNPIHEHVRIETSFLKFFTKRFFDTKNDFRIILCCSIFGRTTQINALKINHSFRPTVLKLLSMDSTRSVVS
jgi:hypothetical protein